MRTGLVVAVPSDYYNHMTFIADLAPESIARDAHNALAESFTPAEYAAEQFGVTILSERDFPVYDDSADDERCSNEDWEEYMGSLY